MKKATKVLIIIAVVSLVLGTILSIVSLLLMKDVVWEKIKEVFRGNEITWEVPDWIRHEDKDKEDVHVEGPFFEVDVRGEDVYVHFFGLTVEVEDGQGRAYAGDREETSVTVTSDPYATETSAD